ncbi:MAG: FtsX-like permease family protein [Acetatifactor sp.]|nr:FtsX-like permease family protein [Acetatifactor sp.]
MNILQKCCFRSMRENRKRTAVTIIGIIMAVALITGVACLAVSFRASIVEHEKLQNGDYHYLFSGVQTENLKYFENNRHIRKLALADQIGYAQLPGSQNPDKPYLYIRALNQDGYKSLSLQLLEGRMPENSSELVISRHISSNGLVKYEVGDVLMLDVGQRISDGYVLNQQNPYIYEEERLETQTAQTYTIVGIIARPNNMVEDRMAPGYSVFTWLEEPEQSDCLEVYVTYTNWGLKHANQVNAGILGVTEDLYNRYYQEARDWTVEEEQQIQAVAQDVRENYQLNEWVLFSFSSRTLEMLYAMAAVAVAIIIITSVFCIRNSFMISLMEKMKLYGRLASVGATSKQQRRIVYYEAGFLGLVGIPIGIVSGILGIWILVRAVGGLVEDAVDIRLIFGISVPAIVIAVLLSVVTIFFSALQSARKAAKISPISAMRSNDMIKVRSRELKCPAYIDRLFGVGGRVAYKNLRRARVKYRTTVVSIVVSVAVFIGMTTFVHLSLATSALYYQDRHYHMQISLYDDDAWEKAEKISALPGVQEAAIVRGGTFYVSAESLSYTEEYRRSANANLSGSKIIRVYSLGDAAYEQFCQRVGVSAEKARDKAIVYAQYEWVWRDEENRLHSDTGKIARFKQGDILAGEGMSELSVEVLAQTEEKPYSMEYIAYNVPVCIVSDSWMDSHFEALDTRNNIEKVRVCLRCEDASTTEESVRGDIGLVSYTVSNYVDAYRSEKSMFLVISIFLYGFITVVALIGITNIFNTVTTNMELRAPEFAMLQAVGMTQGEFRRMIWLEGLFYGGKALLIGLPLGLALSALFHKALGAGVDMSFYWPVKGMALAVGAVFLLLFGIMRYSMGKLKGKNLIETIQNENI